MHFQPFSLLLGVPPPHLVSATVAIPAPAIPGYLTDDGKSSELSSGASGSGSEQSAQKEALGLSRVSVPKFARVCFVQNGANAVAQVAHVINTVRSSKTRKETVNSFIQKTLQINFDRFGFDLDDESNILFPGLCPRIHSSWNFYSLLALVPSLSTLTAMIEMLERMNIEWQAQLDERGVKGLTPRPLEAAALAGATYEVILLHPEHFLANGAPLPIFDSTTNQWVCYTVQDGELKDPSGNRLAPFQDPADPAVRRAALNPLFFTINAYLKIEYHNSRYSSQFPSCTVEIIELIKKLYELIYFLPAPQLGSDGWEIDEAIRLLEMRKTAERKRKRSEYGPRRSPRTSSPLAKSRGSPSGDDREERVDTHKLTTENLDRLEEIIVEEHVKAASSLVNDPKTPLEERMMLGAWFFSPCAGPYPPLTKGMVAAMSSSSEMGSRYVTS
ncbi:hypothetical protein B0H17DRAFT_1214102 [Mycena rosella]|uniref:Uncharacterized protein n=1 Tax=Mycena rosella TaxID=1033263 RepID=A0AAD7CR90_MYCRO|nr:hypothetical protein B0H17DRAFT_1214102 [Mycena rosella]